MPELTLPETDQAWEYKFIPHFTSGLSQAEKSEDLKDTELINALNVRYDKRRVVLDTGYTKFGQTLRGNIRAVFQFYQKTGDAYLTAVTNDTFYVWIEALGEWQYASGGTTTTLTANAAVDATSITVNDITGFSDGDHIGITMTDGTEHHTTINGAPSGSTITFTDALPKAADNGDLVINSVVLGGVDNIPVSIQVFTPTDIMVFVNGVDTPKKFDGTTVSDLGGLPATPFTARVVTLFNDHLMFMYTVEGGTAHPQRVRRSDTGDAENWTTGNAGYTDLFDTEDWIVATDTLGPYLIIYKERSIVRCEYVGLEDELLSFTPVVQGEGARSLDSVVNLGDEHLFFGRSNIYRYKGGYDILPIGDPIYHKVFSIQGHLNPSEGAQVHGIYIEEADEIWFFYPHEDLTFPTKMIRILASNYALSERDFNAGISGYGFYVLIYSRDWSLLTGDWADQLWEWGARVSLANAPTTHLCLGTQIVEYNYLEGSDDGVEIPFRVDTKDFWIPHVDMRVDRFEFSARGNNINVYYSTDEGNNWVLLKTVSPGPDFQRIRIWKQFVGRKVRFRFAGEGSNFALEWAAFDYTLESEW